VISFKCKKDLIPLIRNTWLTEKSVILCPNTFKYENLNIKPYLLTDHLNSSDY